MKQIHRTSVMTLAICAAVCVVSLSPVFESTAQADRINGGYYYGRGYGNYPVYGQGPYVYGAFSSPSYAVYGGGPYGYGVSVNQRNAIYGPYRSTYFGPRGVMTYNGPVGYRGFDGYRH